MTPFVIGSTLFVFSLLIYTLISIGYVYPALNKIQWDRALVPLLLIQCFRFMPLALLMPGQVSIAFPVIAAEILAYGHFISALFALLAVTLVWHKIRGGRVAVWLFSLIGLSDMLLAFVTGISFGVMNIPVGSALFIVTVYMPMVIVSHVLILVILFKTRTNSKS